MQHLQDAANAADAGPLGRRHVALVDNRNRRWVTQQAGGSAEEASEAFLLLSLALGALHDALNLLDVTPGDGPAPVAVTLQEADFLALRDALVERGGHGRALFKAHPSRIRVDRDRRSFMMHGITVAAGDLQGIDLTCPRKAGKPLSADAQG